MSDSAIVQDLRSMLDRLVETDQFSGAVLLASGHRVLFDSAYGYANRVFQAPSRVDTKFNIGSMGKMFTGVAILQLAQAGKLSLDDTLIRDLPDYPNQAVARQITIRQLLTHTSGLGDFFGPEFEGSSMAKYNTLESLLPLFVNQPLRFAPGSQWSYSNAGFIVLGLVVQHVSGESYYDYVREHVFRPAGMTNTGNWPADEVVLNRADGYTSMGTAPGAPRHSNIFMLQRGGSAGGGYSTVEDLFHFARALEGGRLLDAEHTQMDMTGQVPTPRGDKYGFGMTESRVHGVRVVGHGGGGPGINGYLDMYPAEGYTVAILSNYDPGTGASAAESRLQMELTGQALPRVIQLSAAALEQFAGRYQIAAPPPGGPTEARRGRVLPPAEISADADGLWLSLGMGGRHRLLPVAANEFFDEGSPSARFTFARDSGGRVTGFTATGIAPTTVTATRLQ